MPETDANAGQGAQGGQAGAGQQATGAAAAGGNAGANGAGSAGNQPAWHANIDQSIRDFWSAKRYDISDPAKLVDVVTRNYQNAEKSLGVPADELLRIPKPNADTTEITNFWNRVGVPKEAKDYDFSQIKMKDGSDLDPALSDTLRASLHSNRVAKDYAGNVVKDVVKYLDGIADAKLAENAAYVQEQTQKLEANWGNRTAYNLTVARDAMDRFGQLAGMTKDQIDQAVDALTKVGGLGAAPVLEMFRQIGSRMGEAPFIPGQRPPGEEPGAMSREDARAQIDELKKDDGFTKRLLAGDVAAKRQWQNLHQIMTGSVTAAA